MTLSLTIDGTWDFDLGRIEGITYETRAEGGTGDASWTISALRDGSRWGLVEHKPVTIYEDGYAVWSGLTHEVDRDTGATTAIGRWDEGRSIPAVDGSGASTRDVAVAVTQAQGFGWRVARGDVAGVVEGDASEPISVTELLELWAEQEGERVGVDGHPGLYLYSHSDRVIPSWVIESDDIQLSHAGDAPNAFAGRYINASGTLATVYWPQPLPSPLRMEPVDLTPRGQLTHAKAQSVLAGVLKRMSTETRWTNGIDVNLSQIKTWGGTSPTSFTAIRGGDMVRLSHGSAARRDEGSEYLDVILGSVTIEDGSETVHLEPLGADPQTLEEALEAVA